ncbi:MAG: hypothetical protein ACKVQK_26530, partial [Burkholderiales bacterium]
LLDLSDASFGKLISANRSLSYSQFDMGQSGQLSDTLPDGNLALALSRGTGDMLVNGKPITAADAMDALKLSVGLSASKGNGLQELISADVTRDGRVTAADALAILKTSVGINTIQPSWVFVPSDAVTNPNLDVMNRTSVVYKDEFNLASLSSPSSASFTGIRVGDVNNSWVIPT